LINILLFTGVDILLHPSNVFGRFCGGSMARLWEDGGFWYGV
jgi:hypothetical protein